jgi:hypothetical protein
MVTPGAVHAVGVQAIPVRADAEPALGAVRGAFAVITVLVEALARVGLAGDGLVRGRFARIEQWVLLRAAVAGVAGPTTGRCRCR